MAHKAKAILHKRTLSKAEKFQIIVQIDHHDITTSITISLKSKNERIATLKKEIGKQLKIGFRQQELFFTDPQHKKQRLQNDKTFLHYNIKSGNKLKCVAIFSYIILKAQNNTEICRITSDSKTLLDEQVLYFKTLIEKKLIKKGQNVICAKDQFLIYNNQIMQNHNALNEYLKDQSTANIYLQRIICDECKQNQALFIECTKEKEEQKQKLNELTEQLKDKITKEAKLAQSNDKLRIELNYQNNVTGDKIEHLKHIAQKQKRDLKVLRTLNEIKQQTTDTRIKKMLEQIERYKQREIEGQDTDIFTMNRLEDYASYFGDNYPMIASIISYYEGIMLMIGMIFAAMSGQKNEDECTKSEQFVRWLTFTLFLMIPFIIGVYRVVHENKGKKWYERLYQFCHLYLFRIVILVLLLLTCDLKPFSCYIQDELTFQLTIIVVGIFCVMVHAMISRFKAQMELMNARDHGNNEPCDNDVEEKEIFLEIENEPEGKIHDNILKHHQVSLSMDIDINDINQNISDPTPYSLVRQKKNDKYTLLSTDEAA